MTKSQAGFATVKGVFIYWFSQHTKQSISNEVTLAGCNI